MASHTVGPPTCPSATAAGLFFGTGFDGAAAAGGCAPVLWEETLVASCLGALGIFGLLERLSIRPHPASDRERTLA